MWLHKNCIMKESVSRRTLPRLFSPNLEWWKDNDKGRHDNDDGYDSNNNDIVNDYVNCSDWWLMIIVTINDNNSKAMIMMIMIMTGICTVQFGLVLFILFTIDGFTCSCKRKKKIAMCFWSHLFKLSFFMNFQIKIL